jgi:hypothetical protein
VFHAAAGPVTEKLVEEGRVRAVFQLAQESLAFPDLPVHGDFAHHRVIDPVGHQLQRWVVLMQLRQGPAGAVAHFEPTVGQAIEQALDGPL